MFAQRPTRAEIDLGALLHNYQILNECAGSGVEVIPVVKADAYGHGALPVAAALVERAQVPAFAVATVGEARVLKKGGIKAPILILGALYEEDLTTILEGGIVPVLWERESAKILAAAARKHGVEIPVEIKIDTGMGRAGVLPRETADLILEISRLAGLKPVGLLSHLAIADAETPWARRYTLRQEKLFATLRQQCAPLAADGPSVFHLANSAGIMRYDFPGCNRARAGIALYGSYPDEELRDRVELRPVMSVKTGIVLLKRLVPGQSVSYGCTYTAREEILVALLPIGYADGLDRRLSGRGEVLVRGRRAPIIGRVCMDWIMVEVTDIPAVAVGDEVVVLGSQDSETITAEEMAAGLDTISYEIFCNWSPRVPRVYHG
jgi:alanine racemase